MPLIERYGHLVSGLEADSPALSDVLHLAHENRYKRLEHYAHGATLRGISEFLEYLHQMERDFSNEPRLSKVSDLVERARGDFEIGIEAFLAGFHSVLYDTMRDTMEIEFLLRDFLIWPEHVDEWLHCNDQERLNRFRPAVLRQRYANYTKTRPQDLEESLDYKAHSQFLHVTPLESPLSQIGISSTDDPGIMGACLWEYMAHARRIIILLQRLMHSIPVDIDLTPDMIPKLPQFEDAWERCRVRFEMWQSMLELAEKYQPDANTDES